MDAPSLSDSDPFSDPVEHAVQNEAVADSVLVVGRDASLTLATDSLIVLGTYTDSRCLMRPFGLIASQTRISEEESHSIAAGSFRRTVRQPGPYHSSMCCGQSSRTLSLP